MMILSRIWYVILALLVAAAFYIVSLAVGQYNRRNQSAMEETVKADSQVVKWALDLDARRRVDILLLAAVDPGITKSLKAANGKDAIPPNAKEDGAKALRAFNEKLPPEFRSDALFVVDREGRLVAQVGYDAVAAFPEFELGGYPAVFDAMHGFIRDDTWIWGNKMARVVARPVEDAVGEPPSGAVVALRWVDAVFAKEISKRTRTNVGFFALGAKIASASNTPLSEGGLEETWIDGLPKDVAGIAEEKKFKEEGRTDVRPLPDDKGGVLYVRLPGDSWELGGGFAVARPKVAIPTAMGFISGADDVDKKNVKMPFVALIFLGATLIGFLFSFLEHSMPMKALAREAEALKTGKTDALSLPKVRGAYRAIASDINAGIQRVIEKGGGAGRKPADLESILGPVPAQPNMSAFSFPLNDASTPPHIPTVPGGPTSTGGSGARPFPQPPGSRPGPPPPTNPTAQSAPFQTPGDRTMAITGNAGNAQPAFAGQGGAAAPAAPPPAAKGPPPPLNPPPPAAAPGAAAAKKRGADDDGDQTMVAPPDAAMIAATGSHPAGDPTAEWQKVYEDFIRTKKECGEPTDGLTFEKFQQTLKKNRDALMQRHGCKRVKFSVYVKEGRASLKATPVRD